ncbi:MAG: methylmalonyl-CoA mutase family protein [Deltaproteobacteria bacterium]|nr:methylmalonyl-CoA mutase family protein [Deltaproteobacteria bacterium]
MKASQTVQAEPYEPRNVVRVITATSLFDGHDAAINVMRRIIQGTGAEVIHLGHNRSVGEVVEAAVQEDAQAVAVTCYQGGHMEFFKYMRDMLAERGAPHVRIFGGGGGVIRPDEIEELHAYGIAGIYSPEDGRAMGLQGMINHLMQRADFPTVCTDGDPVPPSPNAERFLEGFNGMPLPDPAEVEPSDHVRVTRLLTAAEYGGKAWGELLPRLEASAGDRVVPVIGVTGTGGAGKSSLCDEILRRFLSDGPERNVALLGDRIRMNAVTGPNAFMRSFGTRGARTEVPPVIGDAVKVLRAVGFDLVLVETSGIGQGDSAITDVSDVSVYVMTADFGAQTQLEKIDMIDFADLIAINKFERHGSADALRDVRRQYRRSRDVAGGTPIDEYPVYGTIASQFNDSGVSGLYLGILDAIREKCGVDLDSSIPADRARRVTSFKNLFPPERSRYLGEISEKARAYRRRIEGDADLAVRAAALEVAAGETGDEGDALARRADELRSAMSSDSRDALENWPPLRESYSGETCTYEVRGRKFEVPMTWQTLAGTALPKVVTPAFSDPGEILRFLMLENVPGSFPYTAGVFPFKRTDEEPKRQFAGEGGPVKTNERFHYLCRGEKAKRLSTAFDSATLYGDDPDERPDIWGKVGESGVSVCTLEDIKKLYAGFDLCDPNTSVSMTINGPAPIMLAFFFNAAIDQRVDAFRQEKGRDPGGEEMEEIRTYTLSTVRGTVQADILKEDQAQNTCIFSTGFALRMMGDIQSFFIENDVRNFYSVSISGYHIAEAGANPITQLALTLANGFTYVEYYLSRGMGIDAFGPNLSFFFSNGMDAEYSVLGRVARRIWSVAMREKYGGNDRTQNLKYHIQTSGRSLHEQDMQFNDIRTTLQGLYAIHDNCNSLHTNSYDEAITTPTEESVRRAMAIQLIVNRELGLSHIENVYQGSYAMGWLTDVVEEGVLKEFERLSERGGVLGAMELQYQRGKIQDESMLYEVKKHDGSMPIVGVNTYIDPATLEEGYTPPEYELRRASIEEKQEQLDNLRDFQERTAATRPEALDRLREVALGGGNVFAELMSTVRHASLGQITRALYEVGGKYRRSM